MAAKTPSRGSRSETTGAYARKRDFARTPEPAGAAARPLPADAPVFVVQKHAARRLHWDFRLERDGVLWSWAVPKGPSMDPAHKRLAVHVEDHPVEYAGFEGTIPAGNYGAGVVELWDRGHWTPLGGDPVADLRRGELKFTLDGHRLRGGFVLVRLKPKAGERAENWLLIKERDADIASGADAGALERQRPPAPAAARGAAPGKPAARGEPAAPPPGPPETQAPQLATLVSTPPSGPGWISEIKFDGYRMLCRKQDAQVALITRNGLDWTARVPSLARAVAALPARATMLDGELVALDRQGRSSFAALQAALSGGRTGRLWFYAFDLLHRDGADLRSWPLRERKRALAELLAGAPDAGPIRISEHLTSETARVRTEACKAGLEGIVCKRLEAPYRAGRGPDWLKLKCEGRDEFVILGTTPPKGSRAHLGALLLGRYDEAGALRFIGGVGTGFSAVSLRRLHETLRPLSTEARPRGLRNGEGAPKGARWVRPERMAEIRFAGFTDDGMLRHASFLGLREDKSADEARPAAGPAAGPAASPAARVVVASAPRTRGARDVDGQRLTHPDRVLWPQGGAGRGISKADLAAYWQAVGDHALPGIAGRPLAFVRCPGGIEGEHFFQKHRTRGMPDAIREDRFDDAPYLAVSDRGGLVAAAQVAAIELHSWGSTTADAGHADRLVFDLDPGDGTPFADVIAAAHEVRRRLRRHGLAAYPRTSGGKGLHVVSPVRSDAGWGAVRAWCRSFAEGMERDAPDRYVSTTRKSRRAGRILVDWLRNGLGSTAIASFSPRARPGATVATPLSWREVTDGLDPAGFTIATVPARLRGTDPWRRFDADRRPLNLQQD